MEIPTFKPELESSQAVLRMYNNTEISPLGKKRIGLLTLVKKTSLFLRHLPFKGMKLSAVNMQNILTAELSGSRELEFLPCHKLLQDVFKGKDVLEDKLHHHDDQSVPLIHFSSSKPPVAL